MNRIIFPVVTVCLGLFVFACKSDEGGYTPESNVTPKATQPQTVDTIKPVTPGQLQQVTTAIAPNVPVSASAPGSSNTPVTVPKGMNPPHGQPGHRCDIAVGAPLNSPKAATSNAVQPVSAPTTITAPGMNPPHGQPGHRCDIAVGAPLNSKPVEKPVINTDSSSGN